MATTFETGNDSADNDLVDLEPTMMLNLADPDAPVGAKPSAGVGMREGSLASLSGEINSLRQDRVRACATFLAAAYAVVFVWILFTSTSSLAPIKVILFGSRGFLCAVIALVLWRSSAIAPPKVRIFEYVLFGGMTVILMISQYVINLELLREGDITGSISYIKNGLLQMFVLMFLYGTFIPNSAKVTAQVVLTMALAPVISQMFLMESSELADAITQMRMSSHEQAGTNVVLLLLGASLAIYASYTLNGLREEIHEAKKFGQYQLRDKLGSGGMGDVYLAEHQLLKRPCAIKLIRNEAAANPVALARFEREVQSSARLSHPNTIAIFDYGHTDDGTFYYVMEYLQGMSLSDLVQQAGPLPPGRAIYLMRQACAGLAEAHHMGLVHRDLKPANLLVAIRGGEFDVAKVLDFGLVKLTKEPEAEGLTAEMTVSGTPLYMAPEQAAATNELDARADVYALGAILYFMVTGKPQFQGPTAFAIMMAHARDEVTPPSQVNPAVPADLEAVILKCLAKKPEDRYQDVRTLGKALAACEASKDWDADKAEEWWANPAESIAGKV